jgi:Rieske Fe-S protein
MTNCGSHNVEVIVVLAGWLTIKLIFLISSWCDHLGCLESEVELSFGLVLVGWDLILLSYL